MFKFLSFLTLLFITTVSVSKEIEITVPFSTGGHFSTLVPATAKALNSKGWKTNVKFVEKCGVAKESFVNSNNPVLTVWATNWISDKNHTCYIDVTDKNFVDIYMQSPNFLCGPRNKPDWKFVKSSTYTVAVTNSITQEERNAIAKYGEQQGVKFKIIVYTNTGNVKTAYYANEVDMIFSSIGLEQKNTNMSKCVVNSSDTTIDNIPSLWKETGLPLSIVWAGFLISNFKGLSDQEINKLRNDIRDIIESDPDIKQYMKSKYISRTSSPIHDQLKLIKQ